MQQAEIRVAGAWVEDAKAIAREVHDSVNAARAVIVELEGQLAGNSHLLLLAAKLLCSKALQAQEELEAKIEGFEAGEV